MPLRVMTWNVKFGTCDALARSAIIYDIERHNPGAVLLKDVGGLLDGPLKEYFSKWNAGYFGQYIIASRLPLSTLQVRKISFSGEELAWVRTQLLVGNTALVLCQHAIPFA